VWNGALSEGNDVGVVETNRRGNATRFAQDAARRGVDLVIGYGGVVWFLYGLRLDIGTDVLKRTPVDPRLLWVWLGYAMVIAWKLVRLQGNLERVQRSLLIPRRDE